ncbi:MAG: glutathione S-transferase N-terminal domain-containing protein [Pseudomonadales bacterium]|nr:glutathione S-transferase N-terminal domain-containing protein [Pseudomonadales bacterium]
MSVVTKRSSMVFYSDGEDHYSHRIRIVLAEKSVAVEIINLVGTIPDEVAELNPYHRLPTLVDRDLTLYEPNVMMEYLDERFPHPPLLPVYPVSRAEVRLLICRVEKDWGSLVDKILAKPAKAELERLRKELTEALIGVAPIFEDKPYFMSEDLTLVDCCIAPILWRLPVLGIELNGKKAAPLLKYMDRMFNLESFQTSLTEDEKDMRAPRIKA